MPETLSPEIEPLEHVTLVERQKLYDDGVLLYTDHPLEGPEEAQAELDKLTGEHLPLVAGIRAGENSNDDTFLIVDTRNSKEYSTPYVIFGESGGFKGVRPGESVTIGRAQYKDRFSYSQETSRAHFTVSLDPETDELRIADADSSNGTYLTGHIVGEEKFNPFEDLTDETMIRGVRDDYTMRAADVKGIRLDAKNAETAPYGFFEGHPVLGRKSKSIDNGVYGTRSSEWVVVDAEHEVVQNAVDQTMYELSFMPPDMDTKGILEHIERSTAKILKYDLAATEVISRPHYGKQGTLGLSEYIEAGVGVCRHQALLAGVLLERAIESGVIDGSIRIERNVNEDREAGHAWAVFKQEGQPDLIVDAAQHYVGTRENARVNGKWPYNVRGDIA